MLQGFTATKKELITFLFCCVYLRLTGKNSPAKLGRIHVARLCSGWLAVVAMNHMENLYLTLK